MSIAGLPRTVRTIARLRVIVQVLSRHGFGHFVDRLHLQRFLPSTAWLKPGRTKGSGDVPHVDPMQSIGARLVRVCEELGPTFIKLGQMASTRPDILPRALVDHLCRLQDKVSPFPIEQARRIVQDDVGMPVAAAFRSFSDAPFASGSIAQVHRAVTADGEDVVVKVRRPGIEHQIQLDIYVLQWLAERAESLFPELRPYRPRQLVEEFAQTARRELDFVNEASTTSRFAESFEDDPHIAIPRVRWDLTGPCVLTMAFMQGIHLRAAVGARRGECDLPALARHLSECYLKQYFEIGLFHADPHPGNLFIRPPDGLSIVDFGMVGRMDDELMGRLVIGIVAAVNREVDVVIDVMADVGAIGRDTDRTLLRRDLRDLLEKYYGQPIRRLEPSTLFHELIETMRRNDVSLPRDFVLMFKSLATVSGVVLQLDPELNILALIQPRIRRLLTERISPRRILREAGISSWHLLSVARELPRVLRDLMRRVGRGHFQVNIRHENIDHLASELDRSSNRIAFSVLMAATIMGSSMLLSMATEVTLFHIPVRYLGLLGYGISFVMGVGLVIAILRSGKLS